MPETLTEQDLYRTFPYIPWGKPQPIRRTDEGPGIQHFMCRICTALHGLKGMDIPDLPTDPALVEEHIRKDHQVPEGI